MRSGKREPYTVRAGDTLTKIAASELKDMARWKDIWELNRDRVANENLIYPRPSGAKGNGPRHWEEEDVTFISELIDTLEAAYNIDPTRIYANGLSNGGGMAFVLSCMLSDRIAAVGMVGHRR